MAALLAAMVACAPTSRASAQVEIQASATVEAMPAAGGRDDVQWEERRDRYFGGPVRPGAQVDGSISPFVWMGVGGFAGGYVLTLLYAGGQEIAAVPIVGPWLAIANVSGGQPLEGTGTALMVIGGLLQPAGIVFGVYGLLNPDLFLVYDAPVGQASPFETAAVRLLPGAPGADLGATVQLETF
ncbi:MAG: hypothetical protein VYE22_24475 [Myxococcota bacterium]|nr:hypothetical protein [Myxococcota bacterium]